MFLVQPPDGNLSVVAAGSQESCLLRVPGDAVNVLSVSFGHLSGQRKQRLIRIAVIVLLEHPHRVIATGGGQGTG